MAQPGFAERLKSRLKALGYWKHDRPDVARFTLERGYRPQYVYAWLRDRIPDYENLLRLAQDLRVAPDSRLEHVILSGVPPSRPSTAHLWCSAQDANRSH